MNSRDFGSKGFENLKVARQEPQLPGNSINGMQVSLVSA
jgi:hypothetical protein